MMSMLLPMLWLLAMLGGLGLSVPRPSAAQIALLAAAASATLLAGWYLRISPQAAGIILATLAMWGLVAKPSVPGQAGAGAAFGLAAALHITHGVSPWLAIPLVAIPAAACFLLSAPEGRIKAVLLAAVAAGSPLIGLAPDVAAGWRSAQALGAALPAQAQAPASPTWVWISIALALAAGMVRGFWSRR
jgi:hypothetical protein